MKREHRIKLTKMQFLLNFSLHVIFVTMNFHNTHVI